MKFKIDENLPIEVAELLNQKGYEAKTVMDQGLNGEDDTEIATVCRAEERIIVTLDTDFSNIRTYPPEEYPGLIVLRLKRQDKPHILRVFTRLLDSIEGESITHRLWIVEENRIRVRE